MNKKYSDKIKNNEVNIDKGLKIVEYHPLFAPIFSVIHVVVESLHEDSWGYVTSAGDIYLNNERKGSKDEWSYIIAHCLLHLGLSHNKKMENPEAWNIACDCFITKFLSELKFGKPPIEFTEPIYESIPSEEKLYERFIQEGVPQNLKKYSTRKAKSDFLIVNKGSSHYYNRKIDYPTLLAKGMSMAVQSAVRVAGGIDTSLDGSTVATQAQRAKSWFMSSFPLLGALASDFEIIEDAILCTRMDISVGAISVNTKEIYINSSVQLTDEEMKFLMAHELLHAGLSHATRRQGRDPYLWNVACDYVINGWLIEMKVGDIPHVGGLYDSELKGLSAETIYDRIAADLRMYRKLKTFKGIGVGDIIETKSSDFWDGNVGMDLDEFYRRALAQGLNYHQIQDRGYLPLGLVEEIKSLSQPPIPWDVELAKWFDRMFHPIEKVRTYSRQSRRQASTPNIARPRWINQSGDQRERTFAVIVDTSGSMDRVLLGKALGTIASYSIARDVPLVRVIFCDATSHDEGYVHPEALLEKVKIKGRGGTILQPGIDMIESAKDFPKNGPILIITDGYCDRLSIKREHAFVMPQGARLPFIPRGEVFRMK
ncbi:VWA-like domain-containing protein [Bacillus sp. JJ664]